MDSVFAKQMDAVIVTATRTERKLSNVAVPAQLINNKIIQQSGSVRLTDILQEQTGLFITGGSSSGSPGGGIFGNGIQIQGLAPDYTLVLIDGEPVIGRQGGVIDLSRITVGNIKQIEIVKGPSSSLYGSEAMGGVINIIIGQPQKNVLTTSFRYGRFNETDANLSLALNKKKWGLQFFGNRNGSQGYDLDKTTPGNTVDPYHNYTSQVKISYKPSVKTQLSFSTRYFQQVQQNFYPVSDLNSSAIIPVSGNSITKDISITPVLSQQFSKSLRSTVKFYFNRYQFRQELSKQDDHSLYYYDFFQQSLIRAENQTDWKWQKNNNLSIGGGIAADILNTNRYDGKKRDEIRYLFLQNEWKTNERLIFIGGIRYDDNTAYQSKISPKLAVSYKATERLRVNVSYGSGFKAPDFRQLYLNFSNDAAGGYMIYGANEITLSELLKQQQQGLISAILQKANQLALLKPESSKGFNAGIQYRVNNRLSISSNLFRNDIDNLIQYDIIAYRGNNAPVYSYFNIDKAFTEGAEASFQYLFSKKFFLQGGYQFLITADKNVLKQIKAGEVYAREAGTNRVYKMNRWDYAGLPNRSAHMANLKLFYEDEKRGWSGSFRIIYRSRWGTTDQDGNGIINRRDELAKGFLSLNVTLSKKIKDFKIQAAIENLLNYKDVINLPGQPGIQPYISISYSFTKKNKLHKL